MWRSICSCKIYRKLNNKSIGVLSMRVSEIQVEILKHTSVIKEKVIPEVVENIMQSFNKGFDCGMDIGCTVIRDETVGWLYHQISCGLIEVRDAEKLVGDYKFFIEAQRNKNQKENL